MEKYKEGKIVKGTVTGIESYGIFVSLDDYYSGLIHISEVSHNFVSDIKNFVKVGDIINVEIIGVDEENNHLKLSIKNINYRINYQKKKKKIVETKQGFNTLAHYLPIWIDKKIKMKENVSNSIDK